VQIVDADDVTAIHDLPVGGHFSFELSAVAAQAGRVGAGELQRNIQLAHPVSRQEHGSVAAFAETAMDVEPVPQYHARRKIQ
jgi:hypothetical protein